MDALSVESHRRAAATRAAGDFAAEIVPVPTGTGEFREDETIRPGTTHEALAQLKLAFRSDEMCARFPEIQWGVTAGNASQITDGAAALLLVSERAAKRLGLRPSERRPAGGL